MVKRVVPVPPLVALVFLHGAVASGMVPILSFHMEARAPVAFALYFTGMLIGQLAIFRIAPLSRPRSALAGYEVLFAAALVAMAVWPSPAAFFAGRFAEGIGSGLTLPLIFGHIVRLDGWGSPERRVALMNSAFAGGFVSGPVLVQMLAPGRGTSLPLFIMAAGVLASAAAFQLLAPRDAAAAAGEGAAPPKLRANLLLPLFSAKCVYGYMLAFVSGHVTAYLPGIEVAILMLILSGVFVVGQAGGAALVKIVPGHAFRLAVAAALALSASMFALEHVAYALFAVAIVHSLLALLGYYNFAGVRGDARQFALFNLLSDPALILGATLATLGATGAWGLAILGLAPLLRPSLAAPPKVQPR